MSAVSRDVWFDDVDIDLSNNNHDNDNQKIIYSSIFINCKKGMTLTIIILISVDKFRRPRI